MKKIWIIKLIVLAFVAAVVVGSFSPGFSMDARADDRVESRDIRGYTAHDVIIVNGDSDLSSLVSQEGWPGDGSAGNPYVIENLSIDATGNAVGIYLGNVTSYVIIRNCQISNANYIYGVSPYYRPGAAIVSYYSQNLEVYNVTVESSDYGIYLYHAQNVVAMNNDISNTPKGAIYSVFSSSVSMMGNAMRGGSIVVGGTGLDTLSISQNNTVNGKPVYFYRYANMNNATVPEDAGEVIAVKVSYLRINALNMGYGTDGIEIFYSDHIFVTNTTIENMGGYGVMAYLSNNITVEHSLISHTKRSSIYISNGEFNYIKNNEISGISRFDVYGIEIRSDNNLIEGNYIHDSPYGSGIGIISGTENVVQDNIVDGEYYGVVVGLSYTTVSNTFVRYNVLYNSTHYGIKVSKGIGNIIVGNILAYNNGTGAQYTAGNSQAWDSSSDTLWNLSSGNYWLDWANNNYTNDQDHNGYVDYPYSIAGSAGAEDQVPWKYYSPAPPSEFVVNAGDKFVNLSWKTPITWGGAAASEYKIYRDGALLATVSSAHYYNDTIVQNGQYYLYYVEAVNSKGYTSIPTLQVYAVPWGTNYTAGESIIINSNSDLKAIVAFYNFKGSGTAWDPYVISGYLIDGGSKDVGISIGNTTLHFVIRDCYFYNATGYSWNYGSGVHLYNVTHGSIIGNVFENNRRGVYINAPFFGASTGIVIKDNFINGTGIFNSAIMLWNANDIDIENNTMVGVGIDINGNSNYWGTYKITGDNMVNEKPVHYFANMNFHNEHFSEESGEIIVANSSYLIIENVAMIGYGSNILVLTSQNVKLYNLTMDGGVLTIMHGSYVYVENSVFRSGYIQISSSTSGVIENNQIINALYGIRLSYSDYNYVRLNHISAIAYDALDLWSSSYNYIVANTIADADQGISVSGYTKSEGNLISWNVINNCSDYGIYLTAQGSGGAVNTTIYANYLYYNHGSSDSYVSTRIQAYDDGVGNKWNTSDKGNYWLDWVSQGDSNQDGIVDQPYLIDGAANAQDYLPLSVAIPAPPRNVVAHPGDKYVNLTWSPPVGNGSRPLLFYLIYRNHSLIATVPATQLWYNDTGLVNGVKYSYMISVNNSLGESLKSEEITAIAATVPDVPVNLTNEAGMDYVNLTWNAPGEDGGSPIIEYRIYRNGSLIATVPATQLWYNDTNVSVGVTYTYYVTAFNSVGEGKKSNEVQATPGAAVPEIGQIIGISMGILVAVYFRRRK